MTEASIAAAAAIYYTTVSLINSSLLWVIDGKRHHVGLRGITDSSAAVVYIAAATAAIEATTASSIRLRCFHLLSDSDDRASVGQRHQLTTSKRRSTRRIIKEKDPEKTEAGERENRGRAGERENRGRAGEGTQLRLHARPPVRPSVHPPARPTERPVLSFLACFSLSRFFLCFVVFGDSFWRRRNQPHV